MTQPPDLRTAGLLLGTALLATACASGSTAGTGASGKQVTPHPPVAQSSPGTVQAVTTREEITPVTANTDREISGRAELVRTAAGKTRLTLHVQGLKPDTTHPAHLHTGSCSDLSSPHYRHDPSGPEKPPNELWPSSDPQDPAAGLRSDSAGVANGRATAPWRARPAADTVFVHTPGGTKIACAQLR